MQNQCYALACLLYVGARSRDLIALHFARDWICCPDCAI